MMSPGKIGDNVNPEAIQIGFSTQIQPDVENNIFNLVFGTRYELEGDVVRLKKMLELINKEV